MPGGFGGFPLNHLKICQFEDLKMGSQPEGKLQAGNVYCARGFWGVSLFSGLPSIGNMRPESDGLQTRDFGNL